MCISSCVFFSPKLAVSILSEIYDKVETLQDFLSPIVVSDGTTLGDVLLRPEDKQRYVRKHQFA